MRSCNLDALARSRRFLVKLGRITLLSLAINEKKCFCMVKNTKNSLEGSEFFKDLFLDWVSSFW
ncbi:hypothetical protein ATO12_21535 [Aquimarina atlantica]|uniref:Uncharacterized protein n=1 Tax=Aquimarina atlantica TaxID=1317122 RepID=A0A023BRW8_9FLAO|nr:hypothetical protein ATO12_21535 [Aquimarina atlantica]